MNATQTRSKNLQKTFQLFVGHLLNFEIDMAMFLNFFFNK